MSDLTNKPQTMPNILLPLRNVRPMQVTVALGCLFLHANAIFAQAQQATSPIQHPDAKTLPHSTVSVPLTADQQKVLQDSGLIKPGDQTVHQLFSRHVMPGHNPSNKPQPRFFTPGAPNVNYGGGQVLQKPIVVPVFWGFQATNGIPSSAQDPDGEVAYVLSFLNSLSTSPALATVDQYYNGSPSSPVKPRSLTVTAPIFDDGSSPGANYNESDVQNEVGKIAQQIGNDSEEIIIIFTPHGSTNTDLLSGQGRDPTFPGDCSEHESSQGLNFLTMVHNYTFVTMPYMPDFPSCGSNTVAGPLDGVSINLFVEIAETITDPYAGNLLNIGAGSGWTDIP